MADDDSTQVRELKDLLSALDEQANRRQAYLIVISGGEIGRMHKLGEGSTVVGRARNVDMTIEEAGVSREHVEVLTRPDGTAKVRDCGSTNGSLLNGRPLSRVPVELQDGDKIQVGTSVLLKFSFQDKLDEDFQRHLYSSAVRDALTGVYNKRYLQERLEQEFAYARRHKVPVSMVVIDLDHFKKINDNRGHACGDHVLKSVAAAVQRRMRKEEVFARYGGEEFVVVLRETDLVSAVIFAERIRQLVADLELEWEGEQFHVTMSVGVSSTSARSFETSQELFVRADEMLYKAKHGGRNRVCYDSPGGE